MSKRYGRNQKRRAREEIARLTDAVEVADGLSKRLGEKARRLEDEIDRAKRIAGPHSALFQPKRVGADGPPRANVQMASMPALSFSNLNEDSMAHQALKRIDLRTLLTSVRDDSMQDMVHAEVEFAGKYVCYAMSRMAIDGMPTRYLAQMLGEQIARQLAEELHAAKMEAKR